MNVHNTLFCFKKKKTFSVEYSYSNDMKKLFSNKYFAIFP